MAKYLPQSGVSHLWNKVKSLVATKADSSTAFKNGDAVMTTNVFGGRHLYINKIDNAFYKADIRWNITAKIYDSDTDEYESDLTTVKNMFDGDYETYMSIPAGKYAVITVDFSGGKEGSGYFPGYPYGKMYMSFYNTSIPAEVTARGYCNYASQGIGWKDLPVSYLRGNDNSTANVILSIKNTWYNISQFEFTVKAKSDKKADIAQLEMDLDRPNPKRTPFLNKYSTESLYYNLTAPSFTGKLIGNADTATTATTATRSNKLYITTLTNPGMTISGLQTLLDDWLSKNINVFASCRVAMGNDFISAWNSSDETATYLSTGAYWTFQLISTHDTSEYIQLLISSYNSTQIYSVIKFNDVWGKIFGIISSNASERIGSLTKPIYLNAGIPTACTYTLEKSVPSDAVFTDTTYSEATTSENGLMSAADKAKLDGIEEGANKTLVDNIPFQNSTNPIRSGWIYTNWQNKLDATANAASAAKLMTETGNVAKGSATQPVYFSGGLPQACTYTLGKSVPSNAEFAPEVSSEDNGKLMQVISGAWQTSDFSFNDIFGLIGNQKYTVSNWMPNTSQTIASLSGVTAGTGAVLFEKSGGADYTGTFSVRTDGLDSSCVYSGIKPGEIKTVKFNSMPVFSYSASESTASCAFTITLLYPPS